MKKALFFLCALLISVLVAQSVRSLMIPISFEKRVQDADYIVWGKVKKIVSQREQYSPQINLVMSTITIEIVENWKNALAKGSPIKSFGGSLKGIPYYSEDDPIFRKGDELVLFLKEYNGQLFPLYHQQGFFLVVNGQVEADGQAMSVADFKQDVLRLISQE